MCHTDDVFTEAPIACKCSWPTRRSHVNATSNFIFITVKAGLFKVEPAILTITDRARLDNKSDTIMIIVMMPLKGKMGHPLY